MKQGVIIQYFRSLQLQHSRKHCT